MKRYLYILVVIVTLCFLSKENIIAQTTNSESFETSVPPSGWTTTGSYTGDIFYTSSGSFPTQSPHTGTGEVEWDSYNINCSGCSSNLITPVIDWSLRGSNTPTVSLWFYRDGTAYNSSTYNGEGVNVYVNTSASTAGATLLGFVPRRIGQAPTVASTGWYQYTYNIPAAYNSCTNYIIFNFVSEYGDNCYMDDVQWICRTLWVLQFSWRNIWG